MIAPVIGVHRFSAALGGRPVLHDLSFAAGRGEFVALCGPNGAGKTTLLRALAGLLPGGCPQPREVAYLEQSGRAAWPLTLRQVASLGRIPHGDQNEPAIAQALAQCGIAELADHRIDRVSGGQARRAMLARALATVPRALLLDEPVADLDPAAAHEIMALLADRAASGCTVIAVLHAVDLACRYATRMVVLEAGRIVADAIPEEALPRAAQAFDMKLSVEEMPRLLPKQQ